MKNENTKPQKISLYAQTFWGGVLVNVSTFLMGVLFIGAGVMAGSHAMEWVGFLMFWITISAMVLNRGKERIAFTCPQELADHLRRYYGVVGRETSR
ncbi:hypothetical protein [Acetobacter pasteurianus]|uniref:hypothetical protein n=1 Tax=Acetobacter pasteurianus TaxID=438 RepID=UPI0003843E09|nr:hypothetical protein [Acetobacter pasteurianus]CCT58528.1 hypothetical protein APA386B_411 [Acetobacter pasteurianus 386B]